MCGEHGGDPGISLFYDAGLDYVSCSPFRVPIAPGSGTGRDQPGHRHRQSETKWSESPVWRASVRPNGRAATVVDRRPGRIGPACAVRGAGPSAAVTGVRAPAHGG
ncbi:MAG: putative PEP-binding protein [Ilumatobacteraceae bacterium]